MNHAPNTLTHLLLHSHLPIDNDLNLHPVLIQKSLDGSQTHPQVISVEDLELLNRLELIHVIFWYLWTCGTYKTCMLTVTEIS